MISEEQQNQEAQPEEKKLTKAQILAQKKKEKEKAKKAAAKAEAEKQKEEGKEEGKEEIKEQIAEVKVGKGKKGKGGKGKKPNMMAQLAQQRIQAMQEEEERIKKEEEEIRRKEEEEERQRQEQERLKKEAQELKIKQKEEKIAELKKKGEFKTKAQIIKEKQDAQRRQMLINAGMMQEGLTQVEPQPTTQVKKRKKKVKEDIFAVKQKEEVAEDWEQMLSDEDKGKNKDIQDTEPKRKDSQPVRKTSHMSGKEEKKKVYYNKKHKADDSEDEDMEGSIRSPICCILGHVDTGKTTLLDRIRNTDVQGGEAGGITQQIGATYFPQAKLEIEVDKCKQFFPTQVDMPGLLIIDTPGHESFSNLRSRGSSLCDFAILVIDLMHGIEQQTLESIQLLTMRKTPFLVAVNKIDRIFKWESSQFASSYLQLQKQGVNQKQEFENRLSGLITELAEKGFNTELYWKNEDVRDYVSLVPTSGVTGEGIPDMLSCVVKYTSQFLKHKITMKNTFNCTILEVTKIEGLGTTIDVILVNGVLREGDTICLLGFEGAIVTTIRALLTPHPMKEMRVKNEYLHHKKIKAAMGIKITAHNLEHAVAGSALYRVDKKEDIKYYSSECQRDLENVRKKIELQSQGVCVAASTLGSLEALLQFLKVSKIPVAYICVGNVSKDDVLKAMKNLLSENPAKRCKEFATVLAFDVKILPEAANFSEQNGIKIITGNIIYHLFDKFNQYIAMLREESKKAVQNQVVFPVIIKPVTFFNNRDPLVMGVDVEQGVLKVGTPICIYNSAVNNKLKIGVIESIELNKKPLKEARKESGSVAVRVKTDGNLTAGRQFDLKSKFASIINRNSIDILKDFYRKEMTKDDWNLVRSLKTFFEII